MNKGVMRPGHAQIRVMDMDAAVRHYRDVVGLIETHRDASGRVYLKGWTECDKFSVVLRETDRPGLDFCGFKVASNAAFASTRRPGTFSNSMQRRPALADGD
jgi:catechol 2,3-dioxygenase